MGMLSSADCCIKDGLIVMIEIHTPKGTKAITDKEALKMGIKIPRDLFKEIDNIKKRLDTLEKKG